MDVEMFLKILKLEKIPRFDRKIVETFGWDLLSLLMMEE